MIVLNSFFLGSNGLFDFDLTFFLQAFIFFLFSLIITNIFLLPISENLKKRSNIINLANQKSVIYLVFIFEKISFSLNFFKENKIELNRKLKLFENSTSLIFDGEQKLFENRISSFLNLVEKTFLFKSIYLLSTLPNYIDNALTNKSTS
jgi:hypothetical protein|uniref:CF0 subunit II of ATP synthase n=1 Tax=Poterioochromonas malhamensis TaxID=88167 RepID=A0A7T7BWH3_9STRA|nr:CF0 subunit II of ATP synthase [Poterioochromonas malhamensis]QQK55062.1 CF0 subunit II of ATP synthase [Poterioochromonas malhamensis]